MKRFSFRFARLQKIREGEEEAAMLRLALAQADLSREEKALAKLAGEMQETGAQLLSLVKQGAPGAMLGNADAFRRAVSAAADRQKETVARAVQNNADKQEEFRKARRKAEAIRKLHEKRRGEHRKEFLREAQKELDDIGGSRARAARAGSTL